LSDRITGQPHPAGAIELAERGVYWARYTKNGKPIAYAVDSHGEVVKRYVVQHTQFAQLAVDALWRLLENVDPTREQQANVRVLRFPPPTAERRATLEEYDPYNDPLPGVFPRPMLS